MFQYAAGRALAHRLRAELKLELRAIHNSAERRYELHHFNIVESQLTALEAFRLSFWSRNRLQCVGRVISRWAPLLGFQAFHDTGAAFDADVVRAKGNIYLSGFWQSEKYFDDCADLLRREFAFRVPPDEENARMLGAIGDGEAVCIHVRRGDYVANPKYNAVHGTCSLDYYHQAIEVIRQRVSSPRYFVFSDDPEWAKAHLQIGGSAIYVTHNLGTRNWEDLRLMAACRYFIIANSSFSWWGAWLSECPQKIVVAPSRWFQDPLRSTAALIPPSWIRI